ncbi:NAD(P)-dependent dehydrogenase (short-subunit alcohol dehydrogenase family) [Algoriphagus sp. 4150]|uniref:SDR family NAD(P)-dependent oxidoreductase n=1 Tax=Algoriphagus sp. 4150 TaxID=2817756 RepID=UPI0028548D93|nr:SDR family NAD(P)-dependent oxidoreductase [Algoriphagus sp. 4150]MDR7127943.1 NAD(P)-dependent dehydrogenase (short-subunit alcohol dehydrogenase family) [Algoriphagus sp. 4150]
MENTTINTVAITGAGSGLGLELAIGYAKQGYKVFGTAISPIEIEAQKNELAAFDITFTVTDITNEEDVRNWSEIVASTLGNQGLGILINNAGVLTPGPMEVLELAAIRKEFEVNVLGSISTINSFLPLLRKAKGRILQIGSLTGPFPLPFSGPSSASKATMEAFADVYRIELKPQGIDVIMVQPGNMLTGGPAKTAAQLKKISEEMTEEQRKHYGKHFEHFSSSLNTMQSNGLHADLAAAKIIEISKQIPAPIRVAVGQDAEELLQMVKEKTDTELDEFKMKLFGFDTIGE